MKRTEAREKIQEYLEKNSVYQISSEEILDLVEGLGMKWTNLSKEELYPWEDEDGTNV